MWEGGVGGVVYIRLSREKSPVFTTEKTPFHVGRAEVLREGDDVTVFGCGPLLYEALKAAWAVEKEGISAAVINVHTVKPLDVEIILRYAERTGAIVTVEEHQIAGGLGSAISEYMAEHSPTPHEFIGIRDRFGESGDPVTLMREFGLDESSISEAIQKVYKRK